MLLVLPAQGMIPVRPFGNTGESLPVMGFGCMGLGDAYASVEVEGSLKACNV